MKTSDIIKDYHVANPNQGLLTVDLHTKEVSKQIQWPDTYQEVDKSQALVALKKVKRLLKLHPDSTQKGAGALAAHQVEALHGQFGELHSAHHIAAQSESVFAAAHAGQFGGAEVATAVHRNAVGVVHNVAHLSTAIQSLASHQSRALASHSVSEEVIEHLTGLSGYQDLFGKLDYCTCEECRSVLGPAAYFTDLMRIVQKHITAPNAATIAPEMALDYRRPDLKNIELSCHNTNGLVPYLRIINERLETTLLRSPAYKGKEVYKELATTHYPFNVPFSLPLSEIRIYLHRLKTSLLDIYQVFDIKGESLAQEQLQFSKETWNLLTTSASHETSLRQYYGVDDLDSLADLDVFLTQTSLSVTEVEDLLYQNLSPTELEAGHNQAFFINQGVDTAVVISNSDEKSTIDNLNPVALDQVNRFVRLSQVLGWAYHELDWALHAVGQGTPAITADSLVLLASFRELMQALGTNVMATTSLIFDLKTYGAGNHSEVLETPFDQVFGRQDSPEIALGVTSWKVGTTNEYSLWIAAALGLKQDPLTRLTEALFGTNTPVLLNVSNLSTLYRHSQLAKLLGLPIDQYLLLLKFSGLKKQSLSVTDVLVLHENATKLRASGLSVFDVDYIVHGVVSATVNRLYKPYEIDSWLDTLPGIVQVTQATIAEKQTKLNQELAAFLDTHPPLIAALLNLIVDDAVDLFVSSNKNKSTKAKETIGYLSRWLVTVQKLGLSSDILISIHTLSSAYGITNTHKLNFDQLLTMHSLIQLIVQYGDTNYRLATYLKIKSLKAGAGLLAKITGWDAEIIEQLTPVFKQVAHPVARVYQFQTVFDLLDKTGLSLDGLLSLLSLATKEASHWNDFRQASATLKKAVKARYDAGNDWEELHKQIEGSIGEAKRTATLPAVIHYLRQQPATSFVTTPHNLYEYLLIDVEMSDCAQISYIKEALNAVQLYLTRCRERIEPGIGTLSIPEAWWEWMMHYRVWQANREIFLYPENYFDPARRSSKTNLFAQLETDLKQNDITHENVRAAYTKYMDDFAELARLTPTDAYYCRAPKVTQGGEEDNETPALYLFSRTTTAPYTHYYAVRENENTWSEWTKINQHIPVAEVSPVYAFNKLLLFWVETTNVTHKNNNDSETIVKASIKYTFHNFQGDWVAPQTLVSDQVIVAEKSHYRKKHKKLFPDDLFDPASLWWNKVYAFNVVENQHFDTINGSSNEEKLVVFYGPMINTGGDSAWIQLAQKGLNFSVPSVVDTIKDFLSDSPPSATMPAVDTSDDTQQFEQRLYQVVQDYKYVRDYEYQGQLPVFQPLVLNDLLEISHLSNPDEMIFLQRSAPESSQALVPQIHELSGQLSLAITNRTIYNNYVAGQLHQPDLPVIYQVSNSTKNKNYSTFAVKNTLDAFVLKGDKEAFLLENRQGNPILLNEWLLNADRVFTEESFVSAKAKISAEQSVNIYQMLQNKGYLNQQGLFMPSDRLREEVEAFFASPAKIEAVLGILLGSRRFDKNSFFTTDANEGIDPSMDINHNGATTIFNQLTKRGYLDANGRLKTVIDFDKLTEDVEQILHNIHAILANPTKINQIVQQLSQAPPAVMGFDCKKGEHHLEVNLHATRLTTSAIHPLSRRLFTGDIDHLLTLENQLIPVDAYLPFSRFGFVNDYIAAPQLPDGAEVDFEGVYGKYYWELFFHAPLFIAELLKTNQQFAEAEKWYKYVFDPTAEPYLISDDSFRTKAINVHQAQDIHQRLKNHRLVDNQGYISKDFDKTTDLGAMFPSLNTRQIQAIRHVLFNHQVSGKVAQMWQFRPFRTHSLESLLQNISSQPEIAAYNSEPFDPDAIARLRIGAYEKSVVIKYVDNLIKWGDWHFSQYTWEHNTSAVMRYVSAYNLLGAKPENLGECSTESPATFADIVARYADNIPQFKITLEDHLPPTGQGLAFQPYNEVDAYFCLPENAQLNHTWDTVMDRLYKINHCLNIKGEKQPLPLFQPPVTPAFPGLNEATGSSLRAALSHSKMQSQFRFTYLLVQAKNMVASVNQLGDKLLSALEKRDEQGLQMLRATQQSTLLNLTTLTKEKQIEQTKDSLAALAQNLQSAQNRKTHYEGLYNENLNALEIASLAMTGRAIGYDLQAIGIHGITIGGYLAPSIFGFSDGGMKFGDAIGAGAQMAQILSSIFNQAGGMLSTIAQFERRRDEWQLQQQTADYEVAQINHQIDAANVQLAMSEQDLLIHKTSIAQEDKYEQFLKDKFTNADLYGWMVNRLSTIYFQTYQLSLDMALMAQNAYQHEMDTEHEFIQFDPWDNLYKGLLAGESIALSLDHLERAYTQNKQRDLEIEKTISLLHLNPQKFIEFKVGENKGTLDFELHQSLFNNDYPHHHCRKIKSISVSIPVVVGPYQNIHATLTQNTNVVVTTSGKLKKDWLPKQKIALSKGIDDTGLFVLNFNDEMYLPFEGTGAISSWTLSMPPENNPLIDYASISDIIVKIHYTAKDGKASDSSGADAEYPLLTTQAPAYAQIVKQFVLQQAFSATWAQFIASTGPSPSIAFPVTDQVILPNLKQVKLQSVVLLMQTEDEGLVSGNVTLKLGEQDYTMTITHNVAVLNEFPGNVTNMPNENATLTFDSKPTGLTGMVFLLGYVSDI